MDTKQFMKLVKEGENSKLEYKSCYDHISHSLYETICSFLNHSGGFILIGVNDNGDIKGVNPYKVNDLKNNIITTVKNKDLFLPCPYLTPEIIEIEDKIVIVLDVPCGQYVYRYNGRYYDRNGETDLDITDYHELLISLFERKNPHLFEERYVDGMTMDDIDHNTLQFCRNIISVKKPGHAWLQLSDEEILINLRLAKRENITQDLKIKYAALILFGKESALQDYMPRYRFEALFHMCTYKQYNDFCSLSNRYDDRRTLRCNLIMVYDQLTQFTERYLPDKFYLPSGTTQRVDLRWDLFREIIANLCVHSDYSTGYTCFYHVFKDRVVTKNPIRLSPEIPEGKLELKQLGNYTKNPLLVKVFHELSWVEDMGSGTRNIMRYAPLYFSEYEVEILNGSHFIFSITYIKMSQENEENALRNMKMSQENEENVLRNIEMSQENEENVLRNMEMSQESETELQMEELNVSLDHVIPKKVKHKRHRQIIHLIINNSKISIEEMSVLLDVNEKTIRRDIADLRTVIEHVGPKKGGFWRIINN